MEQSNINRMDQMREHIQRCMSSELSVAQYCKANGFGIATYYYWFKKLKMKPQSSDSFIELTPQSYNKDIEVHFPGGVKLLISQPVSATWLRELCCI